MNDVSNFIYKREMLNSLEAEFHQCFAQNKTSLSISNLKTSTSKLASCITARCTTDYQGREAINFYLTLEFVN